MAGGNILYGVEKDIKSIDSSSESLSGTGILMARRSGSSSILDAADMFWTGTGTILVRGLICRGAFEGREGCATRRILEL